MDPKALKVGDMATSSGMTKALEFAGAAKGATTKKKRGAKEDADGKDAEKGQASAGAAVATKLRTHQDTSALKTSSLTTDVPLIRLQILRS